MTAEKITYVLWVSWLDRMAHVRQYVVRFYYGIQGGMKFTMYGLLISQILLLIFLGYVGMQVMGTLENKSTDNKG